MQVIEEWRPIKGYEDRYDISSLGRVRSKINSPSRIKAFNKHTCGYLDVSLYKNGRGVHHYIHRLVLENFVGPCPKGYDGSHKDGNKRNNCLENLCWETKSDNCLRRTEHGTQQHGSKSKKAKLTEDQVRDIRKSLLEGETQINIASRFKVSQAIISEIKRRVTWKHI